MAAIKIDTLAIAKELEEAGVPIKQAEAQTRVYAKIINLVVEDQLATKQDLINTEHKLTQEIQMVKQDVVAVDNKLSQEIQAVDNKLTQEIQTLGYKLTIRLGTMLIVAVTVLAVIIKL